MTERINELCSQFGAITGTGYQPSEPYSYAVQWGARQWLEKFTLDDLRIVVAYRRKTTEEPFLSNMLKWSFLIGRPDRFEEDLAEAKAKLKNTPKKATEREKVLQATGRSTETISEPKTTGQVMSEAGLAAFEDFKRFREQLEKQ